MTNILETKVWKEAEQVLNTPAGRRIMGLAPEAINIMNGVAPGAMSMKGQRRRCSPQGLERRYSLIENCYSAHKPAARAGLNPAEQELRQSILADCYRKREANRNYSSLRQLEQSVSINAESVHAAKADFYRSTALGKPVSTRTTNVLAAASPLRAIPSTGNTGQNFLPATLSNELISEPFADNPLRGIISMSNIRGLELPKIAFQLDDDDFIGDADTAKEIRVDGDKVAFSRNKFKVKVRISDTVLHGSDVDLVGFVENALRSGLADKEKKVSFATSPAAGEENMSFYGGSIKEITGLGLFEAITAAIADLHEDYREGATVVMCYADYVTLLKSLSNYSLALYGVQPEKIIGKPVVFCDAAEVPIIGDFKHCRLNYDGPPIFDQDKDINAGEYVWVLTCWFDQRRMLDSAFRLAVVEV